MLFDVILGGTDLAAALIFTFIDFDISQGLKIFLAIFLWIKALSTIFRIPIWFGPTFYLAGIVDTYVGIILYFFNFSLLIKIVGLILLIKGIWTISPFLLNFFINIVPIFERLRDFTSKKISKKN